MYVVRYIRAKKSVNSSKLRCNTLPTFKCSSYIATIVGLILRLRAYLTTSELASLHIKIPMLGFSLLRRSV